MNPTTKPQPNLPRYGIQELELFPRLTRALFKEKFGAQAPSWDKTRRIKRWFDSSVAHLPADEMYTYKSVLGVPLGYKIYRIPNGEAVSPNLPGKFDYQKYVLAPSKAYSLMMDVNLNPIGRNAIAPEEMATMQDAKNLSAELSAVGISTNDIVETQYSGLFAIIYPPDEPRRILSLVVEGNRHSVQRLLLMRHAQGYDAPGKWEKDPLRWISIIPQDTGEFDLRPEVSIPMRDLLPNERLELTFGSNPMVVKTDDPLTEQLDDTTMVPRRVKEILARVTSIQQGIQG